MHQHTSRMDANVVRPTVWKRLAWLIGIWAASVSALGVVVEIIRLCMAAVGLKTH